MTSSRVDRIRLLALLMVAALGAAGLSGCTSSSADTGSGSEKVALVGYSVAKPAYDALGAAFAKSGQGDGVSFRASYGASGDQSRAVANGQRADYVAFSTLPDLTRLVPAFVADGWDAGPTRGMVSDSVVVIAVRKGNPKHITGWDDLIKPDVKIVSPDPGSSGSAKWNLLAAFAHGYLNGGGEAGGESYLKQFAARLVSRPSSGSAATQTFLSGTGDVLISYENEAIAARQKGQSLDYLVPPDTFLIENPAATTRTAPQAAKDFLSFVQSAAGQQVFAGKGYRPVLPVVNVGSVPGANDPNHPFPSVGTLTTISDLGGWPVVDKKYFDKTDGIITNILKGVG
jgi:ABC-type sulfate transport system substrate-binding protein